MVENIKNLDFHECYCCVLIGIAILIRLFLGFLRAVQYSSEKREPLFKNYIYVLLGFPRYNSNDEKIFDEVDYWFTFILGIIEIFAYSVLIAINELNVIGAWLGFKTIAQWSVWKENRTTFIRYLIGNAIAVLVAMFLLSPLIKVVS